MPLTKHKVIDVMRSDVASVDPADPLRQFFVDIATAEHGRFVVVDEHQHPVGIVTQGDVVRMVLSELVPGASHLRAITTSIEEIAKHLELVKRASGDTVAHCMTSPVVTVDDQDSLQLVAEIFTEESFQSIPVVSSGRLVGLVRLVDLLGPILEVHDEARRARDLSEPNKSQS